MLRNNSTKGADKERSLLDWDMLTWKTLCLLDMLDCFGECCFAFRVLISDLLVRNEVQGVHRACKV